MDGPVDRLPESHIYFDDRASPTICRVSEAQADWSP